jgi:phosphoribosyl-AMP cyclohydrolase/phosphoribosyl-ATP pyrophosphohydrolase/phosphoribosyl-AMP cyclohydrolase
MEKLMYDIRKLFVKSELVPAIVQDAATKDVLMLAYMNEESLRKTLDTDSTWFYSRSREQLWRKGETSGNVQRVISVVPDCDDDTLLITVEQTGVACHSGNWSCFFAEPIKAAEQQSETERGNE